MTANRRIFLNIIATYGRSVFSILCGLFSIRWVLMALGKSDFGLYGLVGSLAIFIAFFNNQFSGAIARYYAYTVGKTQKNYEQGLLECREWFTTAVLIHTILPLTFVAIGYPIGHMAITSGWLIVPPERVTSCVWLWRYVCISCLIGMLNVPFNAMYIAKQYIAELTIYSFAQTVTKTLFIYAMTLVERDWLATYGGVVCAITVIPQVIICIRAMKVFPECRLLRVSRDDWIRVKQLANYAWWQTFGGIGYLCRHQCLEIVANRFFGPIANASYTVGAQVGGESSILTGALNGAFTPAITSAYGAGDLSTFRAMVYRSCKFGVLLTLVFAIPLGLEIDEILHLWLKNPPDFAKLFCLVWLIVTVLEKLYTGHILAVNATGKIAKFQFYHAVSCLLGLPIAIIISVVSRDISAIGIALIVSTLISGSSDVFLARSRAGLSVRHLVKAVIIPSVLSVGLSLCVGLLPRLFMQPSFSRVCVTTIFVELVLLPVAWFFIMDARERNFVMTRVKSRFHV